MLVPLAVTSGKSSDLPIKTQTVTTSMRPRAANLYGRSRQSFDRLYKTAPLAVRTRRPVDPSPLIPLPAMAIAHDIQEVISCGNWERFGTNLMPTGIQMLRRSVHPRTKETQTEKRRHTEGKQKQNQRNKYAQRERKTKQNERETKESKNVKENQRKAR